MLAARLLTALAGGAAAGLAFEPVALPILLPLAVAAITLACRGVSLPAGFLVGTVFGVSFMLVLLPWLRVIGTDAWLGVAAVEGLFYGLLGLATAVVTRMPWWPAWVACLWVGVELLRGSVPFGGFPWGRLGFAGIDTPIAPLVGYGGIAGLSFAVALVGGVLAWAVLRARRSPVAAVSAVVGTALVVSAFSLLPAAPGADAPGKPITLAVVQGNVPGVGMDAFAERRAVLDNHVRATEDLAARVESGQLPRPSFVVWPENSTDISPFDDATVYDEISAAVDAVGVPVLVGALVEGVEPDEVLNQGIVWAPSRGPGDRYTKNHPVPFGEYIPFRDQVARLVARLDQIPRDMRPGTEPGLLDLNGTLVGDVICFEVAYDDLVREVVVGGAEMIVVQTNNATYTGTGQIEQQFAIARLRAMETGRTVVIAATNGVSGIVDPQGEVVARAPVRTQQVLVEQVRTGRGVTLGVRAGPWIERGLALVGAAVALTGLALRRRDRRRDSGKHATSAVAETAVGAR